MRKPKYHNGIEYIRREDIPAAALDKAKHQLRYFAPPSGANHSHGSDLEGSVRRLKTNLNGPQFPFEDIVDGTNWYDRRKLSRREIDSWSNW